MRKFFIVLCLILFSSSAFSAGQHFRTGVFLHYSIGERIWGPNGSSTSIPNEIFQYNSSHSFTGTDTFRLTEEIFPADEQNNEWYRWREIFENTRSTADIRPYMDANKILMIKTNYFSSEMSSWGSPEDTVDPTIKSVQNYKWHWRKIIDKMREKSGNYFIIWTNSPIFDCTDEQALLSHYFCKWAKDTLATGKDPILGKFPINVFVFDYFHKLTDANSKWKLKSIYSANDNKNYPDSNATTIVAPALVQESFNSILVFENYFNPDMISIPILVSPNDTATNIATNITLKWRKIQFATRYSIQIAQDTGFTSIIESDNSVLDTIYTAHNLYYNTKYYWRVRCYNYGGSSDWSVRRSFTTKIAPPGIPALLQPSDELTNAQTNLYFSWSPSAPAAEKYRFQLAKNANFSIMVLDSQNITVNSILVTKKLDSTTSYYWRVKGINSGGESDWSDVWSFNTISAIPSDFTLVEPLNNTINVVLTPLFKWNKSLRASTYIYQLATDNKFSSIVDFDSTLTDTSYTITTELSNDMIYYWRVRAINSTGGSLWSEVWSLRTIKAAPDVPLLVYPAEGEVNVPVKPTFKWNLSPRAEHYSIQVAHDAEFTNNVYENVIVQDTTYTGDLDLQRNQIYWWRLKAINYAGESDWSSSTSFTILVLPPAASLTLSPMQGDTSVPVLTTFIWNETPNAETYNLQISTNNKFSVLILNKSGISDTTFTLINPLDYLKEYFWRVKAFNAGGEGIWSNIGNFFTEEFTAVEDAYTGNEVSVSPNPFSNSFTLKFNLMESKIVTGSLYSIDGQLLCTFINKWFEAGENSVYINPSSLNGISENGMLICKLRIGNKTKTIKLVRHQ